MPMQSAATTLAYVRQSSFVLTAAEVTELSEWLAKAARSGAHFVPPPTLSAMKEADHPFPQRLDTAAQAAAVAAALAAGLLSPTGLWSTVVVDDRTYAGGKKVDLTSHPDFASPRAHEWAAVADALTAAARRSERVIWFGVKPTEPRGYCGSSIPDYNNPGKKISYYVPGSGYTGSDSIDLDLGDARARWLAAAVIGAKIGGYSVSFNGIKTTAAALEIVGFGNNAQGFYLLW